MNGGVNDGLPANWDNFNTFYGPIISTAASVNLDNIAEQEEVQFDVTAAIQAAVNAGEDSISFGITSPEAIATNARNFFAFSGVAENSAGGDDIAPNLKVLLSSSPAVAALKITACSRNGAGDLVIDFTGPANTTYTVQTSTDLIGFSSLPAQNAPVMTDGSGNGQAIIDSDDLSAAKAFFRVIQP